MILMRQWMVDVRGMCRKHLIGEYRECFTIAGALRAKKQVNGFVRNNCLELLSLQSRFDELKAEMLRRGYKPVKKFEMPDLSYLKIKIIEAKVDRIASLKDLLDRCPECAESFRELNSVEPVYKLKNL